MADESNAPFLDRRRESGPAPRVPSALERHIQTVLAALMMAVLAWMGHKVTSTGETLAALRAESRVQIETLQLELSEVKMQLDRSYSLRDSLRELSYRDAAINAIDERVRYLERQIGYSVPPWITTQQEPLPKPPDNRRESP